MTGLTYTTYKQQLAILAGYTVGSDGVTITYDPNFLAILPSAIDYAELRMQRDLDFLTTQNTNNSLSLTAGSGDFLIPLTNFIVLQTVEVVDGSGASWPLLSVTREFLQNVYGSTSTQGLPQYFAMQGSDTSNIGSVPANLQLSLGPIPDQSYATILNGTIRFISLSSTNAQTFISTYLPDLFLMASMIYVSLFQRNFDKGADDPKMAQSYESQYQELLKGAMTEEARKDFSAAAWAPYPPATVATPTRG